MKFKVIIFFICAFFPFLNSFSVSFEERVFFQKKIEEVFFNNRIWPEENRKAKPSFEEISNEEYLREKVINYLKKSKCLEIFFNKKIKKEDLEDELKRIIKNTKDPEVLGEIFDSLKNNKKLILECLIKPILIERFFNRYYSKSKEMGISEEIEKFLKKEKFEEIFEKEEFFSSEEEFKYIPLDGWDNGVLDDTIPPSYDHKVVWTGNEMIVCGDYSSGFQNTIFAYKPSIDIWEKKSSPYNFSNIGSTVLWTGKEIIIWGGLLEGEPTYKGVIYNPYLDEWRETAINIDVTGSKYLHSAVWTGEEMIIWGGINGYWDLDRSGAIYNLETNSWRSISIDNAPLPRRNHIALWTGNKMIIWGGTNDYQIFVYGGIYDPLLDEWKTTKVDINTPSPRLYHSAVWTGNAMIIWGGEDDYNSLSDGALYYPEENIWKKISEGENSPPRRSKHSTIWTGQEMIIWGGIEKNNFQISKIYDNGYRYDPLKNEWKILSRKGLNPSQRYSHSAIWTGEDMIIWGGLEKNGILNTGGIYNLKYNFWLPISCGSWAPLPRTSHTAIWTGAEMIIFGGLRGKEFYGNGALYIPALDIWLALPEPDFSLNRAYHTAVWTGFEMIVWGGQNESGYLNTGARYDPLNNTWRETDISGTSPEKRKDHTAVWTGEEMIIWGGSNEKNFLGSGARYNPEEDSWVEVSLRGEPLGPRIGHSAIWTGEEMIVWGGCSKYDKFSNEGSTYNPSLDKWKKINLSENTPSQRMNSTAIWTGKKLVIYGGFYTSLGYIYSLNDGGIYDPSSDTWEKIEFNGEGRTSHSAIWTGNEMIVWGGLYFMGKYPSFKNDGLIYDLEKKEFFELKSLDFCPQFRSSHTAIWTGKSMILWGGLDYRWETQSGCIYFPGRKMRFEN